MPVPSIVLLPRQPAAAVLGVVVSSELAPENSSRPDGGSAQVTFTLTCQFAEYASISLPLTDTFFRSELGNSSSMTTSLDPLMISPAALITFLLPPQPSVMTFQVFESLTDMACFMTTPVMVDGAVAAVAPPAA